MTGSFVASISWSRRCRSVRQTAHADTRSNSSPPPASGSATVAAASGSPCRSSKIACTGERRLRRGVEPVADAGVPLGWDRRTQLLADLLQRSESLRHDVVLVDRLQVHLASRHEGAVVA